MWIVVDSNEAGCGLARRLSAHWRCVHVARLRAGDVAIGRHVLVERKTVDDFIASLDDGRLFRQAIRLTRNSSRPVIIQEGDAAVLRRRLDAKHLQGVMLALAVGFRIPVIPTWDPQHTVRVLAHMARQEEKRERRRRHRERMQSSVEPVGDSTNHWPPEAMRFLATMPGVGPLRAESIAAHVQSMHALSLLGVRDLMCIPGIGADTASRIVDFLRTTHPG